MSEIERFKETVRVGYATGFIPRKYMTCGEDENGNLCGCALGAALVGCGVSPKERGISSSINALAPRFPTLDYDFMWGVIDGFDGRDHTSRLPLTAEFLAGVEAGQSLNKEVFACSSD